MFAQLARRSAVATRGGSLRVSGGLPQLVPFLFWVPYAVVALHLGPEIRVDERLQAAGIVLSLGGVVFSLWSIVTLGRHYDLVLEIHAGHELVRSGPFALVRHPVYTGLGLHFLGGCLATGNLLLLAGTTLLTFPAFYARARAEERLLREQFPGQYDRYMREVPMLLPGLRPAGGKK
ncbi:MAG TPA: isoprenylcysteine carboxylmethyltransferase family protein [Candidatus Limnocylindrales bacterium]|nr:isoprenylcysteine carboxylmethyltransferase family protein [Candidatus Limnocylindrales bacterium]